MNALKGKLLVLLAVVVLGLLVLLVSIEPILSRNINPVALTRHAIERCERVEKEVISGISNGSLPSDLEPAFGSVVVQTTSFREGYIKVSEGVQPVVLDAWKQPLQMIRLPRSWNLAHWDHEPEAGGNAAWGHAAYSGGRGPFMGRSSDLAALANVSPRLLSKTNVIIIWSCGPNRSNEFGGGDDVTPLPSNASK